MSRRIGAYVLFDQHSFTPDVLAMIDRTTDLTPVMMRLSYLALQEGRARLASGGEGWAPAAPSTIKRERQRGGSAAVGISDGGGFAPSMVPFWSKRNAGWKTRAPHAHLFEEGTEAYTNTAGQRTARWGSKAGGRVARGLSRDGSRWNGTTRTPARPFAYLSNAFHEDANNRIAAYLLVGEESK